MTGTCSGPLETIRPDGKIELRFNQIPRSLMRWMSKREFWHAIRSALAKEEFPAPEPGQEASYAVGYRAIFDQPGPGAAEIGRGESKAEARG
jgi:hypothetical protein